MEPNFHAGERVLVSQFGSLIAPLLTRTAYAHDGRAAALLGPARGQVVVFYPSGDHAQDPLIKRVVGLPGEAVSFRDGAVYVDDARLDEPYLNGLTTACYGRCDPVQLGPDEYFVMGDNRPNSRDSRSFGPVKLEHIVGQVVVRYWPLDAVQVFP
jgi:signal peptidase I